MHLIDQSNITATIRYKFTFSSEDGNQTKNFTNLQLAEEYMGEFIQGCERWTKTIFFPYDSPNHIRLFKDRKGRVIKIDKIINDWTDIPFIG